MLPHFSSAERFINDFCVRFADTARYLNEQDHRKKQKEERENEEAARELARKPEQFSIETALDAENKKLRGDKQQHDDSSSDNDNDRKPLPPTTADAKKKGKGKAAPAAEPLKKGAAKKAGEKPKRLNDPEMDRRLAEEAGIHYIDQGSCRIDLDSGELVLTEPLVPRRWDFSILKPDVRVTKSVVPVSHYTSIR